jgi:hypothetical protein
MIGAHKNLLNHSTSNTNLEANSITTFADTTRIIPYTNMAVVDVERILTGTTFFVHPQKVQGLIHRS